MTTITNDDTFLIGNRADRSTAPREPGRLAMWIAARPERRERRRIAGEARREISRDALTAGLTRGVGIRR